MSVQSIILIECHHRFSGHSSCVLKGKLLLVLDLNACSLVGNDTLNDTPFLFLPVQTNLIFPLRDKICNNIQVSIISQSSFAVFYGDRSEEGLSESL